MRTTLVAAVLVAAVATFLVVVGTGQVAKADNNGAAVYKDFGCWLIDGDGHFVFTAVGTHSVEITNGNRVTICKASDVANSTGSAVRWNYADTGGYCYVAGSFVKDWDETVGASGEATLRCHLNGST